MAPMTLRKRLDAGWDPEAALTTVGSRAGSSSGPKGTTHDAFGESKSVLAWSKDPRCQVSRSRLRQRLAAGQDMEEALTGAPTRSPSFAPKPAFGEEKILAEWARDPRCAVTYERLIARLAKGWDLERAMSEPSGAPTYEAFGESKTLAEWQRDPRCAVPVQQTLHGRFAKVPAEEAIVGPLRERPTYEAYGESKTATEWIADERCIVDSSTVLRWRIHEAGMSVEEAMAYPVQPPRSSLGEETLAEFLAQHTFPPMVRNDRSVLGGLELDIYLPSHDLAVEFNGLFWHSERFRPRGAHQAKLRACQAAGIRLIQVWEDDWALRRPIVEAGLLHKLGRSQQPRVHGRACTVDLDVGQAEAAAFLRQHHLQGAAAATVRAGLRSDGELVAVVLFKACDGPEPWDLVRYATSAVVAGGFTRLVRHFRAVHPGAIKTFADLCVSDGGLYRASGFVTAREIGPDYTYLVDGQRVHKANYRKARFERDPDLAYLPELTERELAELNGLPRIWDAGKTKFVLA